MIAAGVFAGAPMPIHWLASKPKAYLKRGKNDANDAAAICEAVTRPLMRFVPIKTQEQQAGPAAHDAVECDPRAYGRTRHHLGQGPQWHG